MQFLASITHNQFISLLAAISVIAFIVYRQIRPRMLSKRGLIIIPLIILYFIFDSFSAFHPNTKMVAEIILTSIISIIFGFLACRQLNVYEGKNGQAMAKGSWTYFLWWLATFIVKSFLAVSFGEVSAASISTFEILIPVFFLITTRNAYLYWRASSLHLKHQ